MSLHAVAHGNALNIGTANQLVATFNPEAPRPGDLINWIKRFDTAELDAKIARLEELRRPLANAATDSKINKLQKHWTGDGAEAFYDRWDLFRKYIGEHENNGRRRIVDEQLAAMKDLRRQIQTLYDDCITAIEEHLSGVREAYVAALCEEGDAGAMNEMINSAAAGASIGSSAGPKGALAGTAVGAVIGMINGFQAANEKTLQEIFDLKASITALASAIEQETSTLKLESDSNSGVTLDAWAFEPDLDLADGDWDKALGGDWEVS